MSYELQEIFERTAPITFADSAWEILGSGRNARSYDGDPSTLVETLVSGFGRPAIEEAGILVNGNLAPALDVRPLELLFLFDEGEKIPYDVVSVNGQVRNDQPPCFDAARDRVTKKYLKSTRMLLLAPTPRVAAILRRFRMAATVTAKLNTLNGAQMRSLCGGALFKIGRVRSLDRRAPIHQAFCSLVFVGFDLLNLRPDVPAAVRTAAKWLHDIAKTFDFDTSSIQAWSPSTLDLQRMSMAGQLQHFGLLVTSIKVSLASSLISLDEFIDPTARPTDYGSALLHLQREIEFAQEHRMRRDTLAAARTTVTRFFTADDHSARKGNSVTWRKQNSLTKTN